MENETAIVTLNQSKVTSDDIKAKQSVAEKTEVEIDNVRKGYTSVCISASRAVPSRGRRDAVAVAVSRVSVRAGGVFDASPVPLHRVFGEHRARLLL